MNCDSPFIVKTDEAQHAVPCGRCPLCKKRRVNSWVFRLQKEDERSSSSYFITLTYDNDHLPISPKGRLTLCKRDFQLFMKRLRKLSSNKLRYYAVGEYGTKNWRPHYHIILFNLENIKFVEDAWKAVSSFSTTIALLSDTALPEVTTIGQIDWSIATPDSIAYTCKYIDKLARVPQYGGDDRVPEFSLMSKGLGANYVTDAMIKYHNDDLSRGYVTQRGGFKMPLPRYYANKLFDDYARDARIPIVTAGISAREAEKRAKYESENPGGDYDAHLASLRTARFDKFYSLSKKQRLL